VADDPNQSGRSVPVGPDRAIEFDAAYEGSPPWDIGHPQPAFVELAGSGAVAGRILDVGCGTGEHALLAAGLGLEAAGIDLSPRAIRLAQLKASQRNIAARFFVANALEMETAGARYDTVLDCGLFHVFENQDRAHFVRNLHAVLVPGGRYFMLCFSDLQPGDWGPRRVTRAEIESNFADGWSIDLIDTAKIEITIDPEGARAWLVAVTRL
jgi:2-polyprenyl-3-methyl-5-hydroxy-6-metoxy-1,4-benzoquinol methylase